MHLGFWDFGHELFRSTPTTFPAAFVAGDAFSPSLITPHAPLYSAPSSPRPHLASLASLTPLRGHVSAIHVSSLFHLFDEARQLELARRIASLLSPVPGSLLFGSQGGLPVKGWKREEAPNTGSDSDKIPFEMFCHSPESWAELWDGQVFEKGSVRVDAVLKKAERPDLGGEEFFFLWWSVTRL